MKVRKQMKMTKGLSVTMTATLEEVEERVEVEGVGRKVEKEVGRPG